MIHQKLSDFISNSKEKLHLKGALGSSLTFSVATIFKSSDRPFLLIFDLSINLCCFVIWFNFYYKLYIRLEFSKELSKYKQGKGSVQFPLDEKIPFTLITKIVKYRIGILKAA